MNISLTPELERFVQRLVESGLYGSASEVVRDGLRLLAEREGLKDARLGELRREVARGLASADSGKLKDGSATLREIGSQVRKRGKKRA